MRPGAATRCRCVSRRRTCRSAAIGRLAGYPQASGAIAFDAAIDGPLAAPRGQFSLSGRSLRIAAARQEQLPALAVDLAGNWNGSEIDLNGRVAGVKGETLGLSGSAPLAFDAQTLSIAIPPQGRLALRVHGAGEIANLADLLPLGEDQVAGRFALDAAVNGTVAAPAASGRLTVTGGRYENFATGAVLNDMRLDIIGDRDRLTIREFSARDSAKGSLAAQGGVALGGVARRARRRPHRENFGDAERFSRARARSGRRRRERNRRGHRAARLAARHGATHDRSGRGECPGQPAAGRGPNRGGRGKRPRRAVRVAPKPGKTAPALPASLDIQVGVPGRIFVRGRGLDSEWRGQLAVAGTSEAPQITGSLQAMRGTFDVLGKTFRVTHGEIRFDGGGGTAIDPVLDIAAEVATADITAQVVLHGPVSAPKLTMTSSPAVPQDEILSACCSAAGSARSRRPRGCRSRRRRRAWPAAGSTCSTRCAAGSGSTGSGSARS